MTARMIQQWFDTHFPYFRVERENEETCRLLYNGVTIPAEQWSLFTQFTAALGFPLDFSSARYVGVSVSQKRLIRVIEEHFSDLPRVSRPH